jgi:hypothetical protein
MKLIDILYEETPKPTKTKTADTSAFEKSFMDAMNKKLNSMDIKLQPNQYKEMQHNIKMKVAELEKTHADLAKVKPTPEMISSLLTILSHDFSEYEDDDVEDVGATRTPSDNELEPKPVTPTTLPAIINKQLRANYDDLSPTWHAVKNLPGYLMKPIRTLGKLVFHPLTKTKLDNINVIANVGGGPNDEAELNSVAGFLIKKGESLPNAKILFKEILPEYEADIKMINYDNITFLIVSDQFGKYIYSWPQSDTKPISSSHERLSYTKKQLPHTRS